MGWWYFIKNKFFNKGWKKVVFSFLLLTPFVAIPIVSVVNSSIQKEIDNGDAQYYRYNDVVFSDKNEILQYVESTASHAKEVVGVDNTYYLKDNQNNIPIKFNELFEYQDYLNQYINPIKTTSSLKIDEVEASLEPSDNSLPLDILKHFDFNQTDNSIQIYRGYNGEIFTNEIDAKNSYYRVYDGYQYNDIYFRSKEELMYYLKTVFYDDPANIPAIKDKHVLKVYSENNEKITSSPIDLFDQGSQAKLKKFANDTLQSSLTYSYYDKNANQEQNFTINSERDINMLLQNPQAKQALLNDLEYFKVYQTNGHAGFIVDTLSDDKATFIGQNYVETNQDINGIVNPNNWQSYNETNYANFNSSINESLSNMLNYFALEIPYSSFEQGNMLKTKANWFNYAEISDEATSINAQFRNEMKALGQEAVNLFNDVLDSAIRMEKNKQFNSFLKIPTLYTIAMNLIFNRELSHGITDAVRNYFVDIAYYLDQKIMNLVPSAILESANQQTFFSYANFFNLNNNDFNFNQNIGNIYLDKIKTDFPYLAVYALFQNAPKTNHQTTLGTWSFDFDFFTQCVNKYVDVYFTNDSNANNVRDRLYSESMLASFDYIWQLFSTPNVDGLLSIFKNETLIDKVFVTTLSNIQTLHKLFYPQKSADEQTAFTTFNSPVDNVSAASSLVYYKDLNTRSRLLNFANTIRKVQDANYSNYWSEIPSGVSLEQIKSVATSLDNLQQQAATVFKSTKDTDLFVYGADNLNQMIDLYKGVVKNTSIGKSSYLQGISVIYEKRTTGMSFYKLDNLELSSNSIIRTQERNAIITSTTTSVYTDTKYLSDKTLKEFGDKLEKVSKTLSGTVGIFKKIMSNYYADSTNNNVGLIALKVIRDVLDTGIISLFGPIGAIVNTVLSAILPTVTDLSYVFQLDESNKWYRKGGNKISMLFGLIEFKVGGIEEMKIDKPIPLYKNIDADQYYYNGKKYPEAKIDQLLSDQLYDIYKGKVQNAHFNQRYYYNTESALSDVSQIHYLNSASEAVTWFVNQVTKNPGVNNELIASVVKDYDGTLTSTENDAIEVAISKITSTNALRPTKFVNLPYLKNGYVDIELEQAIQSFQFPVAWEQSTGSIVHATNTNSQIINNPQYNYQLNAAPSFSNYEFSMLDLQERFLNSFQVQSKQTLASELLYTNDFDSIANNVTNITIYKINAPALQQRYFSSIEYALDYLKKAFNFKVISKNLEKSTYYFEENTYRNIYEIEAYILDRLIPMTKDELEQYISSNTGGSYA